MSGEALVFLACIKVIKRSSFVFSVVVITCFCFRSCSPVALVARSHNEYWYVQKVSELGTDRFCTIFPLKIWWPYPLTTGARVLLFDACRCFRAIAAAAARWVSRSAVVVA